MVAQLSTEQLRQAAKIEARLLDQLKWMSEDHISVLGHAWGLSTDGIVRLTVRDVAEQAVRALAE